MNNKGMSTVVPTTEMFDMEAIKAFYREVYGIDIVIATSDNIIEDVTKDNFLHHMLVPSQLTNTKVKETLQSKFRISCDIVFFKARMGGLPTSKVDKSNTVKYSIFGFNPIRNGENISAVQQEAFNSNKGADFIQNIASYMTFIDYMLALQFSLFLDNSDFFHIDTKATIVTSRLNNEGNLVLIEPFNGRRKLFVHIRNPYHFGDDYLFVPKKLLHEEIVSIVR